MRMTLSCVILLLAAPACGDDSSTGPEGDACQAALQHLTQPSAQFAALTTIPAAIAGTVADADGDGIGDNHSPLPGPVPAVVSSASLNPFNTAPGTVGVRRIRIEWSLAALPSGCVEGATVQLHTLRGTVDELDTEFSPAVADGNGQLDDADFHAPSSAIVDAVMSVPAVPTGTEGTFSFDVTEPLIRARAAGHRYFSVTGRVTDEALPFPGHDPRGLGVRSTASGNVESGLVPTLVVRMSPLDGG